MNIHDLRNGINHLIGQEVACTTDLKSWYRGILIDVVDYQMPFKVRVDGLGVVLFLDVREMREREDAA